MILGILTKFSHQKGWNSSDEFLIEESNCRQKHVSFEFFFVCLAAGRAHMFPLEGLKKRKKKMELKDQALDLSTFSNMYLEPTSGFEFCMVEDITLGDAFSLSQKKINKY